MFTLPSLRLTKLENKNGEIEIEIEIYRDGGGGGGGGGDDYKGNYLLCIFIVNEEVKACKFRIFSHTLRRHI